MSFLFSSTHLDSHSDVVTGGNSKKEPVLYANPREKELIRNIFDGKLIKWGQTIMDGKPRTPPNEKFIVTNVIMRYNQAARRDPVWATFSKALRKRKQEMTLLTNLQDVLKLPTENYLRRAYMEYAGLTRKMAPYSGVPRNGKERLEPRFLELHRLLGDFWDGHRRSSTLEGKIARNRAFVRIKEFYTYGVVITRTAGVFGSSSRLLFTEEEKVEEEHLEEVLGDIVKDELESSQQYYEDAVKLFEGETLEELMKIAGDERGHARSVQVNLLDRNTVGDMPDVETPPARSHKEHSLLLNLMDELEGAQVYVRLSKSFSKRKKKVVKKLIASEVEHAEFLWSVLLKMAQLAPLSPLVDITGLICANVAFSIKNAHKRNEIEMLKLLLESYKMQKHLEHMETSLKRPEIPNLGSSTFLFEVLRLIMDEISKPDENFEEEKNEPSPKTVKRLLSDLEVLYSEILKRFVVMDVRCMVDAEGERYFDTEVDEQGVTCSTEWGKADKMDPRKSTIYKILLYLLYSTRKLKKRF